MFPESEFLGGHTSNTEKEYLPRESPGKYLPAYKSVENEKINLKEKSQGRKLIEN